MQTNSNKVSLTCPHGEMGGAEVAGVRKGMRFSAPPEFRGEPGRGSLESLLVLAASSGFWSTRRVLAEHSRLPRWCCASKNKRSPARSRVAARLGQEEIL